MRRHDGVFDAHGVGARPLKACDMPIVQTLDIFVGHGEIALVEFGAGLVVDFGAKQQPVRGRVAGGEGPEAV